MEAFLEFVVGEDETGDRLRFTCDPDKLANYFGKNPEAPHYLTPVFFRREVLQRYYEHPEKYRVADGYLWCGGLWSVQIDNDHPTTSWCSSVTLVATRPSRSVPTGEPSHPAFGANERDSVPPVDPGAVH